MLDVEKVVLLHMLLQILKLSVVAFGKSLCLCGHLCISKLVLLVVIEELLQGGNGTLCLLQVVPDPKLGIGAAVLYNTDDLTKLLLGILGNVGYYHCAGTDDESLQHRNVYAGFC